MPKKLLYFLILYFSIKSEALNFPPGFKLGVATASYQIEGGWNASGKGENIWDRLTHTQPSLISDHSNGDIACDSYHLWQTDIEVLKNLKVDHYRFSLSWTRLLPNGQTDFVNPDGVSYYNKLIDALILNGIEPIVTLYHWDLPQTLQDLGGWTNPLIADYFEDFAEFCFYVFGDRVKKWITINEPASICVDTYEFENGAPDVKSPGVGLYLCGKTILLAHAKAYRLYEKQFRNKQKGKIGITIDSIWAEPKTNKTEDLEAAEREMQFQLGWWAHPIFSTTGDYPKTMKVRISEMSKKENFSRSRLPSLSEEEIAFVQGTFDFLGLNHYHTYLIENYNYSGSPSFLKDKATKSSQNPDWKPSPKIVPWGFRKLFNWVKKEYNNPLVIVTENGYGDEGGLDDKDRLLFLYEYMKAMLLATIEDNCNITGYTVWSIMDNMEWRSGYTVKFGIYDVNFTDPKRTRTPKVSSGFYKDVIKTRIISDK